MAISVLVATYNRSALLRECLGQLARQAFEPGDEVIVVDNGSTDDTRSVVTSAATRFPVRLECLTHLTPGKSRALMAGIAASRGDILALTDDDVLVGNGWLEIIRSLFRDADLGLVGGRVLPRWSRPAPRWLRVETPNGYSRLAAPLALLDYGPARSPLGERTALGANMAVLRRALDAAGGIPLELGKLRVTLLSGEDHQLCERIQARGFPAVYEPRLAVRHYVPPERLRLAYHVRWFFWSGITNAVLDEQRLADAGTGRPVGSRHWVARIVKGAAGVVSGAVSARPTRAAEAMADVAFALGYLTFTRGWSRTGLEAARRANRRVEAM